jgi:hypothetical protein
VKLVQCGISCNNNKSNSVKVKTVSCGARFYR